MATTLQPRTSVGFDNSTAQMEPSRTGIWLALAAITMTFAAFTSAMIVRQGASDDWRHFTLPAILYLNTLLLIGSSISLELFRKRLGGIGITAPTKLAILYITLGLGMMFVAGQYLAWLQLRSEGLSLASAPSASFFYVLTALHGLHVLGGIGAFTVVVQRQRKRTLRESTLQTVSRYWHFMTILWLYLLFLLWQRI